MAAVVVIVGDVFEQSSFESGVFHALNVPPGSCGLLLYNSYSIPGRRELYDPMEGSPGGLLGRYSHGSLNLCGGDVAGEPNRR